MRDLSGNIGLDSQENLLAELAALDEKRSKLSQQHGREMLCLIPLLLLRRTL